MPSEFAFVTRSLSIWSSETPGGSCSTSEEYTSGVGATDGAEGLGERWVVTAKDPIAGNISCFAVNAFCTSKDGQRAFSVLGVWKGPVFIYQEIVSPNMLARVSSVEAAIGQIARFETDDI
jgi:hypothetical protein